MALEILKGIEKIGGFEVKEVEWNQPESNYIKSSYTFLYNIYENVEGKCQK